MAKPNPDIKAKRLERLARGGFISAEDSARFMELEDFVDHGRRGEKWEEWLASFRETNGNYIPLLKKVLQGMQAIGEPHATGKYREFMAELGTMTPGVYSNPWDMTLANLDKGIGNVEDIIKFYSL